MLDLFKWSRTDYLMHMYDEMSQAEEAKFSLADRMLLGRAYSIYCWFSIILWISITSKFSMSYSTSRNRRSYASFLEHCKDGSTIADIEQQWSDCNCT